MEQRQLLNPPSDGISQLTFSKTSDLLLVSSWDKTVRLYDTSVNVLNNSYSHEAAVLCCRFVGNDHSVSGGLDREIKYYDFNANKAQSLGKHEAAVSCLRYVDNKSLVLSGSWDKTVHCIDIRDSANPVVLNQPDKVYTMSVSDSKLVVGTANRMINVYDLKNLSEPLETRESTLLYQTRCIECSPNDKEFAISSIEGRVGIEFFDKELKSKQFAFKCHRQKENGVDMAYPVNTIAYHPIYGTFATGGGDGVVCVWDSNSRKKTAQFPRYSTSISSLAFNSNGTTLAIAVSYTYEQGQMGAPADQIFIRYVDDKEVRPKEKKN